ncbi:PREDICTED: probable sodium-coupled neutral amino acid transporter 6 [Camelina sativa]|uniref:Probable sodium-coupled neutral amino acid transporter 6 n=1 Tax=Camelina sativa TaxID=90675 RepID=A0ABM1RDE0_CAMSA|nr:PREDICTED: probable sodium-coupled neutral amino acid transporter 6 [Camelina sativa]XP_019097028.1 PREDICTED: probable sodium-coupled neutral amino acid transporter 6 [Camelina sativa]
MDDSFGKPGRVMLQVAILVSNIGVLIVYMIIIGDVLAGKEEYGIHHACMLEGWFGISWWNRRTFVLLITTLTVFAPLTCFKRIHSLRITYVISVALAVVFLLITAGIPIIKLFTDGLMMPRLLPISHIILLTTFVCCLLYFVSCCLEQSWAS